MWVRKSLNINSSCWIICFNCSQRLALYLNSLFTHGEHFQTQRFLVKHWRKSQKKNYRCCWKVKVMSLKPSSHPKVFLSTSPACTLSLFTQLAINCQCLLHWTNLLAAKLNAGCKIECVQNLLASQKKNISTPPHTSIPPGLHLPGFHLPSSSPCHQEVAGRG